jgi:predicted TIM-barrel fold metal-dependent hydrolase
MMKRRKFLGLLTIGGLSALGFKYYNYFPDNGRIINPCLNSTLPKELANHDVILSAFEDIDITQVWDGHVHLVGLGDTQSGIWVNPKLQSIQYPTQYAQFHFYLNASCATPNMPLDQGFVHRLKNLQWQEGLKFMLLAFDHSYDENGSRLLEKTAFYTPNDYAASIAREFPTTFEWIASIHPYRQDCVEVLKKVVEQGARGIKWLPPSMGMNPASPLCDRFYEAMAQLKIPLLCHCGDESAVAGTNTQEYGNPLALRRALEWGVTVIVAHCASLGENTDIDKGKNAKKIRNFDLFARLMNEQKFEGLLFGDISAMPQINRAGNDLDRLIVQDNWHKRLLYGSDYPLPAILPLFSLRFLVNRNYITQEQANVLSQVRLHNPLLFAFVLTRHLRYQGKRFSPSVFHTRFQWIKGNGNTVRI